MFSPDNYINTDLLNMNKTCTGQARIKGGARKKGGFANSTPWKLIYGVLCVWISSYSPASNIFHLLCHPIALMDPKIAIYENFSQKRVVVYRTKFKAFQNISGACFFYRVYRKVDSCK